jgi:hypothetical protein
MLLRDCCLNHTSRRTRLWRAAISNEKNDFEQTQQPKERGDPADCLQSAAKGATRVNFAVPPVCFRAKLCDFF